jgi:ring-1,2-phenylacetyl-CoA epoxidase subunit PaaE
MRFACFNGECGTCKCKCITGKVKMAVDHILTREEIENGYILTCVGYPDSKDLVLELE